MRIRSELLLGIPVDVSVAEELRKECKLPDDAELNFQVMETTVDGELYYVCWSGGEMEDGNITFSGVERPNVKFSAPGLGAFETLRALPTEDETIYIQQLRVGKIPMQEKVIGMLKQFPPRSKVCFVGDLAKELDGKMCLAFNMQNIKPYQAS